MRPKFAPLPALAAALLLALPPTTAAAQSMQPGQWTLAMRLDFGTHSENAAPVSACITQQDVDDPTRALPRPGGRCVLSNVERTPERATYELACLDGSLQSKGKALIVYRGDRYDGDVQMSYSERGGPVREMKLVIAARRTGECAK